MEVRIVETPVHGRSLIERRGDARFLAGFHGYAETAEVHVEELRRIPGEWSLLAIQALHPFYTREQKIVASWMTRLDRDLAIADNIEYVRRTLDAAGAAQRVFVGFSQGAAMAFRAAAHLGALGVIALGADVPPDVSGFALPPVLLGRGKRDEWYTPEKFENDLATLKPLTSVTTCLFDGGHEWSAEFHEAAGRFLRGLTAPE